MDVNTSDSNVMEPQKDAQVASSNLNNQEISVEENAATPEADFFGMFHGKKSEDEKSRDSSYYSPSPYADNYKMDHPRRGVAIIFNHVNFSTPECPKREGSNKDRDDLVDIFHELDFDVLVHNDLTAHETSAVLYDVSRMDHTDSDCLVVVVMSHGDNGKINARDRQYPTKRLWSNFTGSACPTLAGKPKLFFVQACRGTGLHDSATLTFNSVEEDNNVNEAFYSIPILADILIMYSTVEGFYSWRDPRRGGFFIQSLVKQLRQHHKSRDLLTILTFVNREVAVDFTSFEPTLPLYNGKKQMCSIVSMLTRLVYFNDRKSLAN